MASVKFDINRCKGCEICVSVCPKKIIHMDTSILNDKGFHPAFVKEQEKCIGCSFCATVCPDVVITVEK